MNDVRWVLGLARRRTAALLGAAAALAVTVAFAAALGSFIVHSRGSLTERAANGSPVDWQVQLRGPADLAAATGALAADRAVAATATVTYTAVPGLETNDAAGRHTTGSAVVVGVPPGFASRFPRQLRFLLGAHEGGLLLQQTAANLGATPGSPVTILRADGGRTTVRADGVVDLPYADTFFQVVGSAQPPTAPPDNVLIVPADQVTALTGAAATTEQVHVLLDHTKLPHDPAAAATVVAQHAKHLEAALAGGATVADDLGAALLGAREDALYAQLLVLLLGVPGIVLGATVAALVVALRGDRRRNEVRLLRLRGASTLRLLRLATWEALLVGVTGAAAAAPLTAAGIRLALPRGTAFDPGWYVGAAIGGVAVALVVHCLPVLRALRRDDRRRPEALPAVLRVGADVALLAAALLVFALTARGGYHVVVVPEGVPTASVNYVALLAPLLAWPGLGLLAWRLVIVALGRRRGRVALGSGGVPELEAAVVRRRRTVLARGAAGLGVALGLALSTAAFTSTYDRQANLDVSLTVGADVALTAPADAAIPAGAIAQLRAAPGVTAVEPLVHRLAYVGADLQDLYGIRPDSIGRVAPLRDSYVPGSTITAALASLRAHPDGVLLSAETVRDYQLHPGDQVRLRLRTAATGAYVDVPFTVIGTVTEFPTAPRDSFIVANASYVNARSGSDAVSTYLAASRSPAAAGSALSPRVGPGLAVHDVAHDRATVTSASGLAGGDLSGLSRLELGFCVIVAAAFSGLVLVVGLAERRRSFLLLGALGATPRQRRRFASAEARALLGPGVVAGLTIGAAVGLLLVRVLNGIFDPAPTGLAIPAGFGAVLLLSTTATVVVTIVLASLALARSSISDLRDEL